MRLKSMNKTNSITLSRKNNNSTATTSQVNQDNQESSYEINSGESGFDLNMDSGDDEIDVGTNADSMLMNFSNNSNTSENSYKANTSAAAGIQNDHQFGSTDSNNFAMPQSTTSMSEADRKRAHHNALERKRRDHIKDSFHTLRDAIPNIKGEKVSTSRAQILKAATDYIKTMKTRNTVFQTDIDLLKKQNNEIELQIRQLEKAKMSASECLRQQQSQSFQIKNELDLNESNNYSDNNNDFKFELNENNNTTSKNNVLVMTKQSTLLGSAPTTSKKFKTIVNAKNSLLNNNGNYF